MSPTPTRQQKQDAVKTAETVALPDDGSSLEDSPTAPPLTPDGETAAMIGHHQQRAMAAALRDHGITTDAAVYAYLSAAVGREISSRKELTTVEAAHIIRDLQAEPIPTGTGIYGALADVMSDVGAVAKDSRNTQQNFNFRGVDAVVNAVSPALRKHRVMVLPQMRSVDYVMMPLSSGKSATVCRVVVAYRFVAVDGSHIETVVAAEAFDMGDKATPKAMSVAFRTALLQALALPTDDPDPDSMVYETAYDMQRSHRQGARVTEPPPMTPLPIDPDLTVMGTSELLIEVDRYADKAGQTFSDFTSKFRGDHGDMSVEAMDGIPPEELRPYVQRIRNYVNAQATP